MKQLGNSGIGLLKCGSDLLSETIRKIENGTAPRIPQGNDFTTAPMLNKEIAKIDFNLTAREIKNKVYGLNPFMGAYAMYQGKKIKFWKVQILSIDDINDIMDKEQASKIDIR